ncbi:MAG TPA: CoA pyrophosphatase [Leptospiraceae bacterium]|nr:CoA pyrophosphatase [Leptospiraceae bacterium]
MKFENQKLKLFRPTPLSHSIHNSGARDSAVIIPIFEKNGRDLILLTRRSPHLKSHPGQISFPGGVVEKGESFQDTARREWEEELGSSSDTLEIISEFQPMHTFTGFIIHPIIARYRGDSSFSPNENEVSEILEFDPEDFYSKRFFAIHHRKLDGEFVYYLDIDHLLWGATCHILVKFLREFADFRRMPKIVEPNLTHPPFLDISKL